MHSCGKPLAASVPSSIQFCGSISSWKWFHIHLNAPLLFRNELYARGAKRRVILKASSNVKDFNRPLCNNPEILSAGTNIRAQLTTEAGVHVTLAELDAIHHLVSTPTL